VIRRLLLVLVVLVVVLLVVADRVGAVVAAHVLADKVQTDEHLASRPDASIGGIPFLTQAADGRYSDVSVTAHQLVTDGVPVTTLTVHLHGVHVSTSDVLHGNVHQVPVDRADGQVFISYADANRYLAPKHLHVSAGSHGQLKVSAGLTVAGESVTATGTGTASVTGNVVHVHVKRVDLGASHLGSAGINTSIGFEIPLTGLPFRISLGSVTATSAGIVANGTVNNLVLGGSPR
jgi:hypothetical protein